MDQRIAFDFDPEVPHASHRQDDQPRVNHPHAEIDPVERNAADGRDRKVDTKQTHQQREGPPVEPPEFGKIKCFSEWEPSIRPKHIPVHRKTRRTDSAVQKNQHHQSDAETHRREQIE